MNIIVVDSLFLAVRLCQITMALLYLFDWKVLSRTPLLFNKLTLVVEFLWALVKIVILLIIMK